MDGLIKTLPAILRAAGDSDELAEAACLVAWKHAAGEGLRDHAVPVRRNQKTLIVAVVDTTWQTQLQSLTGQLLFRLNSLLGQPLVTFIDFRVDPRAVAEARRQTAKHSDEQQFDEKSVSIELVEAAAQIQDPDLRRAFLGAALSCLKRLDNRI
jgi:hypothetical protein